jgi:hypothetical protein
MCRLFGCFSDLKSHRHQFDGRHCEEIVAGVVVRALFEESPSAATLTPAASRRRSVAQAARSKGVGPIPPCSAHG